MAFTYPKEKTPPLLPPDLRQRRRGGLDSKFKKAGLGKAGVVVMAFCG